jgi:dihydroneopterin aldolase
MKLGWTDPERLAAQEILVSLAISLHGDYQASSRDDLKNTIDYALILEHIDSIIAFKELKLLETVVFHLGQSFLSQFPMIEHIDVSVEKKVPYGLSKGAAVRISQTFLR